MSGDTGSGNVVIGYSESWSIDGLPHKPVFTRDDVMGSGFRFEIELRRGAGAGGGGGWRVP